MEFHPVAYAKAHPVAATVIVVVGGVIFFAISGWGKPKGQTNVQNMTTGPSPAQIQAGTALQVAQMNAQVAASTGAQKAQIASAYIGLQSHIADQSAAVALHTADNNLALGLAGLNVSQAQLAAQSGVSLANIEAQKSVAIATIGGQVDMTRIQTASQNHLVDALVGLMHPAPAPTVVPAVVPANDGYMPEIMFNTLKASQPILQGYDAQVAQEIDTGMVKVGPGGTLQIPTTQYNGMTEPGGTYVATNPLDARWAGYTPGSYSAGKGIVFHNPSTAAA